MQGRNFLMPGNNLLMHWWSGNVGMHCCHPNRKNKRGLGCDLALHPTGSCCCPSPSPSKSHLHPPPAFLSPTQGKLGQETDLLEGCSFFLPPPVRSGHWTCSGSAAECPAVLRGSDSARSSVLPFCPPARWGRSEVDAHLPRQGAG